MIDVLRYPWTALSDLNVSVNVLSYQLNDSHLQFVYADIIIGPCMSSLYLVDSFIQLHGG